MFIESPVTTTPEVETDTALDHLYTIREMAEQHRWCRGLVYEGQEETNYCPIGWAAALNGHPPHNMNTAQAAEVANPHVIEALKAGIPPYGRYQQDIAAHNDFCIFGAGRGPGAFNWLSLDWIDRAIEYRKKQL